jgi:hypothetical protein
MRKPHLDGHRNAAKPPVLRRFGNVLRLREESRDVWGWNGLDNAWRDLQFAARTLGKSPGFVIGAVLVLSLGISLNLTLFRIYNIAVLKPLKVRGVESIVEFHRFINQGPQGGIVPYPATSYIRNNADVLSAVLVSARQRYIAQTLRND